MANIKRLVIEGRMPYDLGLGYHRRGSDALDEAREWLKGCLAYMSGPVSGVHISWTRQPVSYVRQEGDSGGTAMYGFRISGSDSIGDAWWEKLLLAVGTLGGSVWYAYVRDTECSPGGQVLIRLGQEKAAFDRKQREPDVLLRMQLELLPKQLAERDARVRRFVENLDIKAVIERSGGTLRPGA